MGTRNLTCVVKDGQFKVAQYGQWDGYPSGNGVVILDFLRQTDLKKFAAQVDKCYFGTDEQIKAAFNRFSNGDGWMTLEQSTAFKQSEFGYLSRDTGAKILSIIMEHIGDRLMLQNQIDFAADGLFCEWAYVIDLDKGTLEVYEGFKQSPVPAGQRFAHIEKREGEYYPIHFKQEFNLANLPTDEEFVNTLEAQDEEVAAHP